MLGAQIIRQINQSVREIIQSSQRLVDIMQSQEGVDSVKEGLGSIIENINNLRLHNAAVDGDVLEAFRTLVRDIRSFNEHNGSEIIPISIEVDNILAGIPHAATGNGHHAANNTTHGEDNHGHGHYHAMGEDHPLVGAHQDSGCCSSCIVM